MLVLCIGKLSPAIEMQFFEIIASSSLDNIATTWRRLLNPKIASFFTDSR